MLKLLQRKQMSLLRFYTHSVTKKWAFLCMSEVVLIHKVLSIKVASITSYMSIGKILCL